MLTYTYITNNPAIATIVQDAGIDRIFVDMEYIGKADRQGGLDTVQNAHTIEDIAAMREVVKPGNLLVRVNPIHDADKNLTRDQAAPGQTSAGSKAEIDAAINAGADIIMLPFATTPQEVQTFVELVDGRARTKLLIETFDLARARTLKLALATDSLDEAYIGLNDLSLTMGKHFMFEPLADGFVDTIVAKLHAANIPFGIGGIASAKGGAVPGSLILREHYRLNSSEVIISRSFCDTTKVTDPDEIRATFTSGLQELRALEQECQDRVRGGDSDYFAKNCIAFRTAVQQVVSQC